MFFNALLIFISFLAVVGGKKSEHLPNDKHAKGRSGQHSNHVHGTVNGLTQDGKLIHDQIVKEAARRNGDKTLTGALIGAELRCQGFHCPQWVCS